MINDKESVTRRDLWEEHSFQAGIGNKQKKKQRKARDRNALGIKCGQNAVSKMRVLANESRSYVGLGGLAKELRFYSKGNEELSECFK